MVNNRLQSEALDFLRFPMIVAVVFIHNDSSTITIQGVEVGSNSYMPLFYVSSTLFSQVIASIAVPLFFFMSGFLFFLCAKFNKGVYFNKIKSRFRTLLIPYLFWNISFITIHYVVSHLPGISSSFSGVNYTWEYFTSALWGRYSEQENMSFPIVYQFWFIRDLMVIVILTPLIFYFLKFTKWYGLLAVGLCWFLNISIPYQYNVVNMVSLFFFMAGAHFSICRKNLVEEVSLIRKNWIYLFYILVAIADLCTKKYTYNLFVHNIGILLGIICCFKLSVYLLIKCNVKPIPFLSAASFFVFAVYNPWLLSIGCKKILFMIFQPENDLALTSLYFIIVLFVVIIALIFYYLLKRFLPRFTTVITGGR